MRVATGRTHQARVMADTASTGTGLYAAANWMALTETATAPADADTALAGELTLGGLGRAQATYAYTAGANSYTLTKTYTSSDATARTIQKAAILNASSAGTMVFESAVPNPPSLVSGDALTVTLTTSLV